MFEHFWYQHVQIQIERYTKVALKVCLISPVLHQRFHGWEGNAPRSMAPKVVGSPWNIAPRRWHLPGCGAGGHLMGLDDWMGLDPGGFLKRWEHSDRRRCWLNHCQALKEQLLVSLTKDRVWCNWICWVYCCFLTQPESLDSLYILVLLV